MNSAPQKSLAITGVAAAIGASLCCITPVLAMLAGATGIAATFSWIEPVRPWLIGMTILILGFAWYQKLKKPSANAACECANVLKVKKNTFFQSKKFLAIVTVFAAAMVMFPYYAHVFYPSGSKPVIVAESENIRSMEFSIKGMTCQGCAVHVKSEVDKLPGILEADVGYETANALVRFDKSIVTAEEIEAAINSTGYKVVAKHRQL